MTATGDQTTFYTVIGEGPDGFGRHHFVMFWWGYHPCSDHSVRGQNFHAVIAEHRARIEARGDHFEIVNTVEQARSRASADNPANDEHDGFIDPNTYEAKAGAKA